MCVALCQCQDWYLPGPSHHYAPMPCLCVSAREADRKLNIGGTAVSLCPSLCSVWGPPLPRLWTGASDHKVLLKLPVPEAFANSRVMNKSSTIQLVPSPTLVDMPHCGPPLSSAVWTWILLEFPNLCESHLETVRFVWLCYSMHCDQCHSYSQSRCGSPHYGPPLETKTAWHIKPAGHISRKSLLLHEIHSIKLVEVTGPPDAQIPIYENMKDNKDQNNSLAMDSKNDVGEVPEKEFEKLSRRSMRFKRIQL